MRRLRLLASLLTLVAALLIAPAAGSQETARSAPTNDDFVNARPITIGRDHTVTNIHEATVDPGQPATSGCGTSNSIYHTVWYTFSLPYGGTAYFSTAGSLFRFVDLSESLDTKIAIYTGSTLGTLTQVACSDDSTTLYGELTFSFTGGTTYTITVGSRSAMPLLPGSTLRLVTRMLAYGYFLSNGSFETPLTGADWIVTGSSGDGVVCSNPTYHALGGACAFRFVGDAGENTRLKLSEPLSPDFVPRKGGTLYLVVAYRAQDAALGNTKIKHKVVYGDGTPTSTAVVNLNGAVPTVGYLTQSRYILLASKNVSKVRYQIDFKSETGVLMIDSAMLYYYTSPVIRGGGVLPPPAAPKN